MGEHKTERRTREIGDIFCVEPGCEYYDQLAVQGHCHTVLDDVTDAYIEKVTKRAYAGLHDIKAIAGPEKYLDHLESYYISATCNWEFALDELVTLRRENARLKHQLGAATDTHGNSQGGSAHSK